MLLRINLKGNDVIVLCLQLLSAGPKLPKKISCGGLRFGLETHSRNWKDKFWSWFQLVVYNEYFMIPLHYPNTGNEI